MSGVRWVHCRFCQQTYAAGQGERCSLCGKDEALRDADAPPPAAVLRASWATPAGPDGGVALTAGCVGIVSGAALGGIIGPDWLPGLFSPIVGAMLGAAGGAVLAVAAATLVSWIGNRQ